MKIPSFKQAIQSKKFWACLALGCALTGSFHLAMGCLMGVLANFARTKLLHLEWKSGHSHEPIITDEDFDNTLGSFDLHFKGDGDNPRGL
jgi:hypothetical protein